MDDSTLQLNARSVVDSLSALSPGQAILVLHHAMGCVLSGLPTVDPGRLALFPEIDAAVLLRPRRGRSKIESNPELQRFVHDRLSIPYITLTELCKAHFGADVAPSKSSVHRYIQKLRRAAEQQAEQRKEKHRARHRR